ncbi:MAG: DUF2909 domain-containing protein [Methylococcaceae bacterium]|nr:MAG: DUF2909 domain-containing protein [Methylococcaceae bacterium]
MIIKMLAIAVFFLIVSSLVYALYNLIKGKDSVHSAKTLKALTFRIAVSVALFVVIVVAMGLGLFRPHGIGVVVQAHKLSSAVADK